MADRSDVTRRDLLKRGAVFGGAVVWSTPMVQAIGMSRAYAQTSPVPGECVSQYAAAVAGAAQGLRRDGSAVDAIRSDTTAALGAPDVGDGTFFSLGFGGSITLQFVTPVPVGSGATIVVSETTNGPYPLEMASVSVSQDGGSFTEVGIVNNVGTNSVSVAGISFPIQYVRVTDTSNSTLFPSNADGFDVNAVQIVCP